MKTSLSILALTLAPLVACTTQEAPHGTGDQAVLALGIRNAVLVQPGLVSSGQPTEEQFAELSGLGYRTVILLRPADEEGTGWEEARADQAGLRVVRIPVAGVEDVTEANARALDEALEEAGGAGVVVACASGNRVGGLFALRAHVCQGMAPEAALELGKSAGLTRAEPAVRKLLGLP